jgi:drug/metabolite transporter (DMT)-like permease
VWLIALLIASVSGWAGLKWPKTGVRALPTLGLVGTFGLVGAQLTQAYSQQQQNVSVWPVVLASAAFFYLWWLGALLFDLVFVWNVHVRHSKVADQIETIVTQGYIQPPKAKRHSRFGAGRATGSPLR